MSSASLAEAGDGVLAAWETKGQVYFARIDPEDHGCRPDLASGRRRGSQAPGRGGQRGGRDDPGLDRGHGLAERRRLAWQVFDRSGRPRTEGRVEGGVPVWGLATVVARPDGGFTIIR